MVFDVMFATPFHVRDYAGTLCKEKSFTDARCVCFCLSLVAFLPLESILTASRNINVQGSAIGSNRWDHPRPSLDLV
jgi:hypothetical protein